MTPTKPDMASAVYIEKSPMLAVQPSKLSLRDELQRQMAEFERTRAVTVLAGPQIRPLLESPRKPLPEWEARRKAREKAVAKLQKTNYSQPDVMAMFGCDLAPEGYRKFDRLLEQGTIPEPDVRKSVGAGRFAKSWVRDRIDRAHKAWVATGCGK